MQYFDVGGTDWAVVFSTLAGPIFAVQMQKWIERSTARAREKQQIFEALMSTRNASAQLSREHVRALNMIELAFHGSRFLGVHWQTKNERAVVSRWRNYVDQLNVDTTTKTPKEHWEFGQLKTRVLVQLLLAMGKERGFEFGSNMIASEGYTPFAEAEETDAKRRLLAGWVKIVEGAWGLPVWAKQPPPSSPAPKVDADP